MPNATPPRPLNPAELRSVFADNLRILCAREPSISELCRNIAINRSQFARYLAGEAFPRPDVLHRICIYFQVDANILVRPLSHDAQGDTLHQTLMRFADMLRNDHYDVRQEHLPDGYYQHFRRSMAYPDYVIVTISRIWRENGVTLWKSYEPSSGNIMMLDSEMTPPTRRQSRGVTIWQHRGTVMRLGTVLCVMAAPVGTRVVRVFTIDVGLGGNPDLYTGYISVLRGKTHGVLNVTPLVTQRISVDRRRLFAEARQEFFRPAEAIPARLRSFLFQAEV